MELDSTYSVVVELIKISLLSRDIGIDRQFASRMLLLVTIRENDLANARRPYSDEGDYGKMGGKI